MVQDILCLKLSDVQVLRSAADSESRLFSVRFILNLTSGPGVNPNGIALPAGETASQRPSSLSHTTGCRRASALFLLHLVPGKTSGVRQRSLYSMAKISRILVFTSCVLSLFPPLTQYASPILCASPVPASAGDLCAALLYTSASAAAARRAGSL